MSRNAVAVEEALYANVDELSEIDSTSWLEHETELGVADYFTARYGDDLRFVHVANSFFCWDGQRWKPDVDGAANRLVHECVRNLLLNAIGAPVEADVRQRRTKFALKLEGLRTQQAVLTLARDMKPIATTVDAFDRESLLFNVRNGTIDLKTGELRAHQRDDMISKASPIAYDPAAECPRWLAFLAEIFPGDTNLVEYVQRAVGYSLTGESREHVIFIPLGSGANGKSTFLTTISDILGDYATSASAETFVGRKDNSATNDLARLHNARFVSAVEAGENKSLSEAFVKSVTGGDPIIARFLFREFFEFEAIFKLWLATNHRPTIRGADDGIWRRIKLIPFSARFAEDERDARLREKLQAEYPGILAWAMRGAQAYLSDGLGNADAVDQATAGYRSDMDTFGSFLEQCCAIESNASATTPELVAAFTAWAEQNGEHAIAGRALSSKLQDRGFKAYRTNKKRGFFGLRLRQAAQKGDASDASGAFLPSSYNAYAGDSLVKTSSDRHLRHRKSSETPNSLVDGLNGTAAHEGELSVGGRQCVRCGRIAQVFANGVCSFCVAE